MTASPSSNPPACLDANTCELARKHLWASPSYCIKAGRWIVALSGCSHAAQQHRGVWTSHVWLQAYWSNTLLVITNTRARARAHTHTHTSRAPSGSHQPYPSGATPPSFPISPACPPFSAFMTPTRHLLRRRVLSQMPAGYDVSICGFSRWQVLLQSCACGVSHWQVRLQSCACGFSHWQVRLQSCACCFSHAGARTLR